MNALSFGVLYGDVDLKWHPYQESYPYRTAFERVLALVLEAFAFQLGIHQYLNVQSAARV